MANLDKKEWLDEVQLDIKTRELLGHYIKACIEADSSITPEMLARLIVRDFFVRTKDSQ